jgi:hypothetical protein
MPKQVMAKDAKVGKNYSLYGTNLGKLIKIEQEEWASFETNFVLTFENKNNKPSMFNLWGKKDNKYVLEWGTMLDESDISGGRNSMNKTKKTNRRKRGRKSRHVRGKHL